MKLDREEQAMLDGLQGPARREALRQQMEVGRFFDAEDFVEVAHAHLMADTESLGESGVEWLEGIARLPEAERRVRVPTVTDPRGIDFCNYRRLRQEERMAALERRAIAAFESMGILMTDTCINYQSVLPPVRGEHLAYGDTGSTIYANSVLGARSNFEGGPAALCAALTGRVPRYGCHLDEPRRGTRLFEVRHRPRTWSDWGALGAVIGKRTGDYWSVPVLAGIDGSPTSDELKHFGAALASYGSVPLFHMAGVTPEAPDVASAFEGTPPEPVPIGEEDVDAFYASFGRHEDEVHVVVFAAPQLSLVELQAVAGALAGKRVNPRTALLVATSPEIKVAADRMGITATIEDAGAVLLRGVCFYQMYARELGRANGWTNLLTNSAKLVNIISGYGYRPVLATTEACIEAAVRGRM